MIAVFPGSFDPITFGHLDIVKRAACLFEKLIIGVGINPEKKPLFSTETRVGLIIESLSSCDALVATFAHRGDIEVSTYQGLTIDFAKQQGATVLVRAIRDFADLQFEMHQARLNRRIGGIETLFLSPSDSHLVTSSTLVRQIWEYGQKDATKLVDLVPQCVIDKLQHL